MSQQRAPGARLFDLHLVRAGMVPASAVIGQAEGLRRQSSSGGLGRPDLFRRGFAVGDVVRDNATGELGAVQELKPECLVVQFPGRRRVVRAVEISGGAA